MLSIYPTFISLRIFIRNLQYRTVSFFRSKITEIPEGNYQNLVSLVFFMLFFFSFFENLRKSNFGDENSELKQELFLFFFFNSKPHPIRLPHLYLKQTTPGNVWSLGMHRYTHWSELWQTPGPSDHVTRIQELALVHEMKKNEGKKKKNCFSECLWGKC